MKAKWSRAKLIINDRHVGVNRVAGTTPTSAAALRARILEALRVEMFAHLDKDIIINGDLFDAYDIVMGDALAFYKMACDWLDETLYQAIESVGYHHPDEATRLSFVESLVLPILVLGQGNHDVSKDSSRLSAFAFIAAILVARYPDRVRIVAEPEVICEGIYMIPHCVNQEIFNLELARARDVLWTPSYILLHANFDNNFTAESDHSLNVSRDQASELTEKGHVLIFGHEHQAREPMRRVTVVGNQFPTSVADCLNNPGGMKRHLILHGETYDSVVTWSTEGSFTEFDWRNLALVDPQDVAGEFIRVIGTASAEEAAAAMQAISKLRQKSQAYVVTNAVKIEGLADMDELKVAVEEMKETNVLDYLYEQLEPPQIEAVKKLMEQRETA